MTKDEALRLALEALEKLFGIESDVAVWRLGGSYRAQQAITAIKAALEAKDEPVAWISTGPARMIHWTSDKPAYGDDWVALYTTPPQRKPLTDEPFGFFQYDIRLDAWVQNRINNKGVAFYIKEKNNE